MYVYHAVIKCPRHIFLPFICMTVHTRTCFLFNLFVCSTLIGFSFIKVWPSGQYYLKYISWYDINNDKGKEGSLSSKQTALKDLIYCICQSLKSFKQPISTIYSVYTGNEDHMYKDSVYRKLALCCTLPTISHSNIFLCLFPSLCFHTTLVCSHTCRSGKQMNLKCLYVWRYKSFFPSVLVLCWKRSIKVLHMPWSVNVVVSSIHL